MNQFRFRWSAAKSAALKRVRGVSFEELLQGEFITTTAHPTRANQTLLFVLLGDQIWVAPFVPDDDGVFLKTLYRSRKHTKLWRKGELT